MRRSGSARNLSKSTLVADTWAIFSGGGNTRPVARALHAFTIARMSPTSYCVSSVSSRLIAWSLTRSGRGGGLRGRYKQYQMGDGRHLSKTEAPYSGRRLFCAVRRVRAKERESKENSNVYDQSMPRIGDRRIYRLGACSGVGPVYRSNFLLQAEHRISRHSNEPRCVQRRVEE